MRYIYVTCPENQGRRHMVRVDAITGIVDSGEMRMVLTNGNTQYPAYEDTDAIGVAMLHALRADGPCAFDAAEYDFQNQR